jgi:NADPH-dependent 2,4-dienoyl-CoA reductase/sulfur reductase-like enzyme/nitrite reductase/ring-hydroxylating ferredoxin subunit
MKRVASLAELPADRGHHVEVDGQKILLVRDGAAVRAYSAVCPHAGAPLEEGAVCNGRIVCPWHKAAFRLSDGALMEPPALDGLAAFPVRVEGDDVFVDAKAQIRPTSPRRRQEEMFVIVGAGAAGATGAVALREFGFGGRIVLIGREPGLPFDRTSLSKFVVSGEMKPEETPPLREAAFYDDQDIERIEAEVVGFDVAKRELNLADGRGFSFAQALLAPGGTPKSLAIPGAEKRGVHVLRSREDAASILADIRPGVSAVILGSSFIGLEVASCLRAQHISVAVVSPEQTPFARQFGERIGRSLRALHEANGVVFHAGAKPSTIEGDARVSAVVLEGGRRLEADMVLMAVGVEPRTRFLRGAAMTSDGGVVVDSSMRVAEGVFAAGDIAAFPLLSGGKPTRIEHWRVAQQQARLAAANMLGNKTSFDATPFFWTYHYGQNFEYLGHADIWDDEIVLGDVDKQNFVAFLLQGRRVAAVVACGRERLTAILSERMRTPLLREEAVSLARSQL